MKIQFFDIFDILWSFRYFLVERHEFEDGKCSQIARFHSEILSNIEPNTWKNSKFSKTIFFHHLNLCKVYVYAIPIWSVKYNYTKINKNFFLTWYFLRCLTSIQNPLRFYHFFVENWQKSTNFSGDFGFFENLSNFEELYLRAQWIFFDGTGTVAKIYF